MAEAGFYVRAKLSERAVIFDDLEQRVVSEAVIARFLEANSPMTIGFVVDEDVARGIGKRRVANIVGRASFQGNLTQLIEQVPVVCIVGRVGTGVPCGIDARCSVQSVDHETAIFAKNPLPQVPGLLAGFKSRILGKRRPGLFDFDGFREAFKRLDVDPGGHQQVGEFPRFFSVVRTEN